MNVASARVARRKAVSRAMQGLALLFTGSGLVFLIWILWTLASNGVGALALSLFTENTPPPGSAGGLANAIVGSMLITGTAILVATPIGILAGTFLAEYGKRSNIASVVRFINDVLLSAPSILVGLFVYELIVLPAHGFSGWAGSTALGLIALPVIVRTTEDMLALIPAGLREAGVALGAPPAKVIVSICYRAARAGMLTGVLLALARISGETAPLLFTSLNNQFWSLDMSSEMANLPVVIFQFAMSPYDDWHQLAWAAAFLITMAVLGLSIVARLLLQADKGAR